MESFHDLIDSFIKSPSDVLMKEVVDRVERNQVSDEDIAYLAMQLAKSGDIIPQPDNCTTADIASTGGPSSLSTLLCPLYLRALGYSVSKLALPGRPAGGIDVLAQIPGFRIEFTSSEVNSILRKNGYIHFLASSRFVPLDAVLFSFRRRSNRINIPGLAIASLLAKKKAAGVSLVGLDVRVAIHGNFGCSMEEAAQNASRFCRVATLLNCNALCFLSDANKPYQPFIGRGEALLAVFQILSGETGEWLRSHDDMCYAMAHSLAYIKRKDCSLKRPSAKTLISVMAENLESQGASYSAFEQYIHDVQEKHNHNIVASETGFLSVNIESLRTLMVSEQDLTNTTEKPFTDPCGIILKRNHGAYVHKDDIIASIRCLDHRSDIVRSRLEASFRISQEPIPHLYFNEVNHG